VGKGGVGKTTVSSAFAVHHALKHPRDQVLLISTDPAHSLSDIFEQELGYEPVVVKLARARLHAWQVDAESRFRKFIAAESEQILSILESGSIFTREDIAPLLETTLPGMAEMSALLAVHDALRSEEYEQIVVDTAPFGHTLRMFEMPDHFVRFLDFLELASSRDQILAQHFGGAQKTQKVKLISKWRKLADEVLNAFSQQAGIFLVTTPERFSLNESVRCRDILRKTSPDLGIDAVVLNRVVVRSSDCKACTLRSKNTGAARQFIGREFSQAELYVGEDPGAPIVGLNGLRVFGAHVFSREALHWKAKPPRPPKVRFKEAEWPVLDTPLSLVLGKGGVGKTTLSAGLGLNTREHGNLAVEICSVDPAPSLDDVFQTEISNVAKEVLGDPKFRASEMDAAAMFQQWVAEIKATLEPSQTGAGVHVDLWFERQLFFHLLDSVPPGLDEILAVFKIMDLVAQKKAGRVVIDMAPTGHALDLLRTPERILVWTRLLLKTLAAHRTLAIARDAGMKVAELGQNVRELLQLLRNPKQTRVIVVMLAEPLPDRETERLMQSLEQLNAHPGTVMVNRLNRVRRLNCDRCESMRRWQMFTLGTLVERHPDSHPCAVDNFPAEIAGKKELQRLTRRLWQVS
jgi:arsenite-transporting ATPase